MKIIFSLFSFKSAKRKFKKNFDPSTILLLLQPLASIKNVK